MFEYMTAQETAELDKLNDKELLVIEATVSGLCKAKEPEE